MTATQSLSDMVADAIESSIRENHLPAGAKLGTKTSLLQQHAVAPATLNEALRILRERSAIVVKPGPGGGIFVADQPQLSRLAAEIVTLKAEGLANTNSAVEVLDGLDLVVAHHAAHFRTAQDIAELRTLRERLITAWPTPQSESANWAAHRRIADITPNLMLRSFYQNLVDYILAEDNDPTLGVTGFNPQSKERLTIHLDLLDAIIDGHEDRIDTILEAHRNVKN